MTQTSLSSSSLILSLKHVADASTEAACAQALVSAATLLQSAILTGHPPEDFHAILESVPSSLGAQLQEVMSRAVNFHLLGDGGTLGLWLVPVALSMEQALPSIIALETQSLNALKLSGSLLKQLGLARDKRGLDRTGWTYVIPALYSDEQIRNTDLGTLVRLPHEARDVVRGDRDTLSFKTDAEPGTEEGSALYFLPFVAFSPSGFPASMPADSSHTTTRLSQWVAKTLTPVLGDQFTSYVSQPHPFTAALETGRRLYLDVKLRSLMLTVSNQTGVEPNGMAALVAPYTAKQSDGAFMVGITLVSRMTQNFLATVTLPVESDNGQEELAATLHILKDMGMVAIQHQIESLPTYACQHCGKVQFAMPSPAVARQGVQECAHHIH